MSSPDTIAGTTCDEAALSNVPRGEVPRSSRGQDVDAEIEEHFQWLRMETLKTLLITLAIIMWLATIPYLLDPDDFWRGWGLALFALVVILGCYAIKDHNYNISSSLFIASLVALISTRMLVGVGIDDVTPFLFIPVVLIAGTLQRTPITISVAVFASATVLAHGFFGRSALGIGSSVEILLAIWLTVLILWLTKRNLYTTILWYCHSQEEATRSLEETRRHRGELAGALKELADATYRLERMNYALNWARLEAEQARRAKAQFAAHVSHELRTPINLIVGFSDMMLNVPQAYGEACLPLAYQTDLDTLHRNAKHLEGMIDDILDLSQLDAQEMPLLRELVPVANVIYDAVAAIRQLLERKNLSIDVDIRPEVTVAYLDPLRIRQVLLNLLSNASRHTTVGGVTIHAWRNHDQVAISVADTGEGINPSDIPYLFEAFHRIAPSPTGAHDGWGLGLAICKQFIELHDGTIAVDSEGVSGRGATFTMTLPVHPEAAKSRIDRRVPERLLSPLSALKPPVNVVVIDPDPHAVNLFRRHLTGYQVLGAPNDADALDLAQEVGVHALLVNLPPGAEQAHWHQRWMSVAEQKGIRVLGCPMVNSQQLAQVGGLVEFLVKPITREALLKAVRRANPRARTIAVIDDDLHMVRMLNRMLHACAEQWRILRAYDAEEGLTLIRRTRPDIVLLDLIMPGGGGLSLLKGMQGDPSLSHVAVIAVSAQDMSEILPPSNGQVLSLITSQALTITQTLRAVRTLLDVLPPAEADRIESAPAHVATPAGSVVSG